MKMALCKSKPLRSANVIKLKVFNGCCNMQFDFNEPSIKAMAIINLFPIWTNRCAQGRQPGKVPKKLDYKKDKSPVSKTEKYNSEILLKDKKNFKKALSLPLSIEILKKAQLLTQI